MKKPEAEYLYDPGKEPTVARLLELDDQVKELKTSFLAQPGLQQFIKTSLVRRTGQKVPKKETTQRQETRWLERPQR